MALSKTTFTDYSTVISADFLNTLQDEVINGIGYGTCSTAAATKAKVVTISDFTLETGATVKVKFTYTNTASSPTLNVNDTGAKSIARFGTTAAGTDVNSSWRPGQVVTFVYDGTYWQMQVPVNTYIAGDEYSQTVYIVVAGQVTSSSCELQFVIPIARPIEASTFTLSAISGTARHSNGGYIGYLDSSGNYTSGISTYDSIAATIIPDVGIRIRMICDAGWGTAASTVVTNNVPLAVTIGTFTGTFS